MNKTKKWEVRTALNRVLDSHDDHTYAVQLADYQARKTGMGVWVVPRCASLDSDDAEYIGPSGPPC